jgi:hypothetical protein
MGRSPGLDNYKHAGTAQNPTSDHSLTKPAAIRSHIATPTAGIKKQSPDSDTKPSRSAVTRPPVLHHTTAHSSYPSNVTFQIPRGPSSLHALDHFLETFDKIQKAEDDLNNIKSNMLRVKGAYVQQRTAMAKHIDVEVLNRHKEESRELRAKQCREVRDLKQKYAEVKEEQEQKTNAILQQEQMKLAELQVLRRDLDQKGEGLSKDQLLDHFVAQNSTTPKRKRNDS